MPVFARVGGVWKKQNYTYVKVSGAWKTAVNTWVKVSGVWKRAYTYSYSYSGWTACTAKCGGGTQTRTASCRRSDGVTVSDAFCTASGVSKGALSQACNTQACYGGGTYTSNATFTAPHNGTFRFTLYGGGGGSGKRYGLEKWTGDSQNFYYQTAGGGGGGGGGAGYSAVKDQYLSAGQTVSLSVGAGGAANSGNGGSTVIGGSVSASAAGGYGGGAGGSAVHDEGGGTGNFLNVGGGAGNPGGGTGTAGTKTRVMGYTGTLTCSGGSGGAGGSGVCSGGAGGHGGGDNGSGGSWSSEGEGVSPNTGRTNGAAGASGRVQITYLG